MPLADIPRLRVSSVTLFQIPDLLNTVSNAEIARGCQIKGERAYVPPSVMCFVVGSNLKAPFQLGVWPQCQKEMTEPLLLLKEKWERSWTLEKMVE